MNTKERILNIATQEFLNKGFQSTSLRKIARAANVTTGAMYGYYKNKEALFNSLVEEVANNFEQMYYHQEVDQVLLDYIYLNFDIFKLIICGSETTDYEDYLDRLVENQSQQLSKQGVDDKLSHIINHSYLFGVFEIVRHQMNKEQAEKFITDLNEFYQAGWNRLDKEKLR